MLTTNNGEITQLSLSTPETFGIAVAALAAAAILWWMVARLRLSRKERVRFGLAR